VALVTGYVGKVKAGGGPCGSDSRVPSTMSIKTLTIQPDNLSDAMNQLGLTTVSAGARVEATQPMTATRISWVRVDHHAHGGKPRKLDLTRLNRRSCQWKPLRGFNRTSLNPCPSPFPNVATQCSTVSQISMRH
jgi:hypothetical protein